MEKVEKNEGSILNRFLVTNDTFVKSYLEAHKSLFPFLNEAADKLGRYFPQSELELLVIRDPESNDEQVLFIYVRTSLPVDDSLARLDRFDNEWFLEVDHQTNHTFNVNLRFV